MFQLMISFSIDSAFIFKGNQNNSDSLRSLTTVLGGLQNITFSKFLENAYYNIRRIEMSEIRGPRLEKPTEETIKLYEQIVVKNFQILKTILPRMNSIYQLNEQLQRSVSNIESRLIKMQNNNENLHYEMRTSHLAIDSKLNTIIADYNNLTNQTSKFKKQTDLLSREVREVKSKQYTERSERKVSMEENLEKEMEGEKTKKAAFVEPQKQEQPANFFCKNKEKEPQCLRRSSISVDNDQPLSQSPKVHFKLATVSLNPFDKGQGAHSANELQATNRKTNLKLGKPSLVQPSVKSQKAINSKPQEVLQGKGFQNFLKEIENYHFHNQKVKQNYEELMEEYCKKNQEIFTQLQEQINAIATRINSLEPDKAETIEHAKREFTAKFGEIKKQIKDKLDRTVFEKIMNDFNVRVFGLHEQRKNMANRDETKRALEFLEQKVNGMLNDYYQAKKRSVHLVSVDKKGCLRVADIYQEGTKKEYNRDQIYQTHNAQTAKPSERATTPKRQASSLHNRIAKGNTTESRFNERQWRPMITEKGDQSQQTARKSQRVMMGVLKKKSYQILDREKVREKPRLRKERLVFEYD